MTWTNGRRTSPFEPEIGDKLVLEVIALSIVRVSASPQASPHPATVLETALISVLVAHGARKFTDWLV
jgi:hypothetical protein